MANLISAFSFAEFMGEVWDALTSKTALIVYAAIILVLILFLVIRISPKIIDILSLCIKRKIEFYCHINTKIKSERREKNV